MGTYKNKAYTLRLDNDLMEKIREIAEKEDRPLSKQIERIIRQYIENYEKETNSKYVNVGRDNNGNVNIQ